MDIFLIESEIIILFGFETPCVPVCTSLGMCRVHKEKGIHKQNVSVGATHSKYRPSTRSVFTYCCRLINGDALTFMQIFIQLFVFNFLS